MARRKTTELAEDVKQFLDSIPADKWSDLKIGEGGIQTKIRFDPTTLFEEAEQGIFILPVVREYNLDSSQGRIRKVTLNSNPMVAICIYYPFGENDVDEANKDVAKWDSIKRVINLREEMEELIGKHEWPLTLINMEAEVAEDIPLAKRTFFAPTVLTFEDHC